MGPGSVPRVSAEVWMGSRGVTVMNGARVRRLITQSPGFSSVLLLAITSTALLACGVRSPARVSPDAAGRPADVSFAVNARKFDFDPGEIRVKQGQVVELRLTATDRKHGFALEPFGIRTELLEAVPVTVRFVADRRGAFTFRCNVFCGLGHLGMSGKLIVE